MEGVEHLIGVRCDEEMLAVDESLCLVTIVVASSMGG